MVTQKELLHQIQQYDFALQEASLYLNAHPEDQEAMRYYQYFRKLSKQAKEKYETAFGPLTNQSNSTDEWKYIFEPWPWEREE